jgi:hypothetical protein
MNTNMLREYLQHLLDVDTEYSALQEKIINALNKAYWPNGGSRFLSPLTGLETLVGDFIKLKSKKGE